VSTRLGGRCLLLLVACAFAPQPAVAARSTLGWARARAVDGAPAGAPSPASFDLDSVACASPNSCVAVGSYIATLPSHEQAGASGSTLPVIVAQSRHKWLQPRGVALPANALRGKGQAAALEAVACRAVGSCVAIGSYVDRSGAPQEMVLSQARGAWTPARELALSSPSTSVSLSSLACRTASSCVAVGSAQESAQGAAVSSSSHPVIVSETGGSWGPAVEVALPAGVSGAQNATFSSVACPAAGSCTAVGYYEVESVGFSPPAERAILAGESANVWGAASAIGLASQLRGVSGEQLKSVACTAPGTCEAVGSYEDRYGDDHPIALGQIHGVWGAASAIVAPANAGGGASTSLEAVACPVHGSCVAVGQYDARGGAVAPMAVSSSGSQWGHASEIASPLGAGAGPGLLEHLLSLACPGPRFCLAVGDEIAASTLSGRT
jgi:hypothetical protein